jgi:hypothetical protein
MPREIIKFACIDCKKKYETREAAVECESKDKVDRLAELLHRNFCRFNHDSKNRDPIYKFLDKADCDWYEKWKTKAEWALTFSKEQKIDNLDPFLTFVGGLNLKG